MASQIVELYAALAASTEPLMKSIGKPLAQLQAALAGIVSPALRSARAREQVSAARAVAEARASEANAARARAEILASEASAARARAEALAREASTARAKAAARAKVEVQPAVTVVPAIEPTPEQRLLAALREELGWARARHGSLLDTLGLDRLAIGEGAGGGVAVFDAGIVLQRRHPLVERILRRLGADGEIDAIDLMFVVSAVYTLMNEVAEAIDAEDEAALACGLIRDPGRTREPGVFADVEQQTHRAWLRRWYEAARELLGTGVKAEVDADAWAGLYGTVSRPFAAPSTAFAVMRIFNASGPNRLVPSDRAPGCT